MDITLNGRIHSVRRCKMARATFHVKGIVGSINNYAIAVGVSIDREGGWLIMDEVFVLVQVREKNNKTKTIRTRITSMCPFEISPIAGIKAKHTHIPYKEIRQLKNLIRKYVVSYIKRNYQTINSLFQLNQAEHHQIQMQNA